MQTRKRTNESVEIVEVSDVSSKKKKNQEHVDLIQSDDGSGSEVENDVVVVDISDDEDAEPAVAVDQWEVEKMTVPAIKEMLKARDLSVRGDKKVLSKRLIERLTKELNPEYKAKPKGRHCKWCDALMSKKRGFKGDFYGCSTYPECQYTTSLPGHANPKKEFLKGVPAGGGGGRGFPLDRVEWARLRQSQEDRRQRKEDKLYEKCW